jgi:hypothetical protein
MFPYPVHSPALNWRDDRRSHSLFEYTLALDDCRPLRKVDHPRATFLLVDYKTFPALAKRAFQPSKNSFVLNPDSKSDAIVI